MSGARSRSRATPQTVKRATSSYAFFVKQHFESLKAQNPALGVPQLMPLLAQQWKALGDAARAVRFVAGGAGARVYVPRRVFHAVCVPRRRPLTRIGSLLRQPFVQLAAADVQRAAADRVKVRAAHPPKKPSAYAAFVKEQHSVVAKANPQLAFGEVGRALAARWKAMTAAEKQVRARPRGSACSTLFVNSSLLRIAIVSLRRSCSRHPPEIRPMNVKIVARRTHTHAHSQPT